MRYFTEGPLVVVEVEVVGKRVRGIAAREWGILYIMHRLALARLSCSVSQPMDSLMLETLALCLQLEQTNLTPLFCTDSSCAAWDLFLLRVCWGSHKLELYSTMGQTKVV